MEAGRTTRTANVTSAFCRGASTKTDKSTLEESPWNKKMNAAHKLAVPCSLHYGEVVEARDCGVDDNEKYERVHESAAVKELDVERGSDAADQSI